MYPGYMAPGFPGGHMAPGFPGGPVAPGIPAGPVGPGYPAGAVAPSYPTGAVAPGAPGYPTGAMTPGAPGYPTGTVAPGTGAPMTPGTVPVTPAPETIRPAPKVGQNNAPATILVSVPENAKLTIDETATTSTSAQRVFVTPALEAGKAYHYTMKVEYVQDGKPVVISKKVDVTAGTETTVNFVEEAVAGR